jgi:ubiquitin C-terminal hydrolase
MPQANSNLYSTLSISNLEPSLKRQRILESESPLVDNVSSQSSQLLSSSLDDLSPNDPEYAHVVAALRESLKEHRKSQYNNTKYWLQSVILHEGASVNSGHYVCDVYDLVEGKWKNYDDSVVQEINETDLFNEHRRSNCYLLFYYHNSIHQRLEAEFLLPKGFS